MPVCILGELVVGLLWGPVPSWLDSSWDGGNGVIKRLSSSQCSFPGVARFAWPCWT